MVTAARNVYHIAKHETITVFIHSLETLSQGFCEVGQKSGIWDGQNVDLAEGVVRLLRPPLATGLTWQAYLQITSPSRYEWAIGAGLGMLEVSQTNFVLIRVLKDLSALQEIFNSSRP